jgi:hypothetical protein
MGRRPYVGLRYEHILVSVSTSGPSRVDGVGDICVIAYSLQMDVLGGVCHKTNRLHRRVCPAVVLSMAR